MSRCGNRMPTFDYPCTLPEGHEDEWHRFGDWYVWRDSGEPATEEEALRMGLARIVKTRREKDGP